MGIYRHHDVKIVEVERSGNPDPQNYKILNSSQYGNRIALKVLYPDCTNREGVKILVYEDNLVDLINQRSLDPHFGDKEDYKYPIARFEPTDQGWKNAVAFCEGRR